VSTKLTPFGRVYTVPSRFAPIIFAVYEEIYTPRSFRI
jgi:hypothetical protein